MIEAYCPRCRSRQAVVRSVIVFSADRPAIVRGFCGACGNRLRGQVADDVVAADLAREVRGFGAERKDRVG